MAKFTFEVGGVYVKANEGPFIRVIEQISSEGQVQWRDFLRGASARCSRWFDGLGSKIKQPSWVDDHFASRTPKQHFQTVQHITPQDSFIANKVCLQSAWVFLSIQIDPDTKVKRAGVGAVVGKAHTAHPNRLVFSADAGDKGASTRCLGRVEHGDRAGARRDHGAIGKADLQACSTQRSAISARTIRPKQIGRRGRSRSLSGRLACT
jgi:hypothetical protein